MPRHVAIVMDGNGRWAKSSYMPRFFGHKQGVDALVRTEGESAKIAVRNLRRDANEAVKKLVKDKQASEDEHKRAEADIQKVTDRHIAAIDQMVASKEQEILAV